MIPVIISLAICAVIAIPIYYLDAWWLPIWIAVAVGGSLLVGIC